MENSNLAVILTFRQPLKIYKGPMLHVRGFPDKERIAEFFCSHSQKQITQIDGAQQSNKNKSFSNFVGHFYSEKSDFCTCVELCMSTGIFVKIHLGLPP